MDKDIESADEGQRNRDRWSGNPYRQLARATAQALPEVKLPSAWIEMGENESETRQSVRKEKQRVNERRVTHYCQIATAQALPELKLPGTWIEMGGNESETRHSVRKEKQRVSAGFTNVRGLAVAAFDLVYCSLLLSGL